MRGYFGLRASRLPHVSFAPAPPDLARQSWYFKLCPRVCNGFFELRIFPIDKINTGQPSCTVELRLLDRPVLLFFSLSCF